MQGFFSFLTTLFYWGVAIIAILAFIAFRSYNRLQAQAQLIKARASNSQIAISKKLSLVNQLIDIVKSFQESEQFTHLKVSADSSSGALSAAYQQSGTVLTSIQGLAERFPQLKASEQYHRLIDSIQTCENEIQITRTDYNDAVRIYNTDRLSIPTVFVARFIGFGSAPYLEFDHTGASPTTLKEFKTDDGERLQELISGAGNRLVQSSKALVQHTTDAGRAIQDRFAEASASQSGSPSAAANRVTDVVPTQMPAQYFFMEPGGVPSGPETLARIQSLQQEGALSGEIRVAQVGTQNWIPVPQLGAAKAAPVPAAAQV